MKLFDLAALTETLPEHGLERGDVGTIVEVFDEPRRAYEVEFVDDDGYTIALVALRPDQLELVEHPRTQ